jgi:hypothetical protein
MDHFFSHKFGKLQYKFQAWVEFYHDPRPIHGGTMSSRVFPNYEFHPDYQKINQTSGSMKTLTFCITQFWKLEGRLL